MIALANSAAMQWTVLLGVAAGLLVAGWALHGLERRRWARLGAFAGPRLLPRLAHGYAAGLRRPLNILVFLGLCAWLVALAEPEWGVAPEQPARTAREILVLLDTSESMNAANPAPSRLDRAQRKITALLSRHPADRFGLIAFSGGAALQCPLTSDHGYFRTVLHYVDTEVISQEGTDIQAAFHEAAQLYAGEPEGDAAPGRESRIVLLISDGEAVSGDAVGAAEALASKSHVMVLGIGDPEGAEVKLPQWNPAGSGQGATIETHWSRLDESRLSAIAVAGDGVYVRSTLSDDDVDVIGRELAFLRGARAGEASGRKDAVNRYRWPLAAAGLFFALEGVWLVLLPRLVHRTGRSTRDREVSYGI